MTSSEKENSDLHRTPMRECTALKRDADLSQTGGSSSHLALVRLSSLSKARLRFASLSQLAPTLTWLFKSCGLSRKTWHQNKWLCPAADTLQGHTCLSFVQGEGSSFVSASSHGKIITHHQTSTDWVPLRFSPSTSVSGGGAGTAITHAEVQLEVRWLAHARAWPPLVADKTRGASAAIDGAAGGVLVLIHRDLTASAWVLIHRCLSGAGWGVNQNPKSKCLCVFRGGGLLGWCPSS